MSKSPNSEYPAPTANLWLLDGSRIGADDLAYFRQKLGASETRRFASFVRRERGRQFLLGRMLLRLAVSDLTGIPCDTIGIVERPGNAPRLVLPDALGRSPNFSLSHSRNWVACIVSRDAGLGLDIEVNDAARDIAGIGELAFHPSDRDRLCAHSNGDRVSAFYDLWCAEEALYKLWSNLGHEAGSAAELRYKKFERHRCVGPSTRLSIVVLSNRRLCSIRERILTDLLHARSGRPSASRQAREPSLINK